MSRKDSRPFASLLPCAQDHGEEMGVQEEETTHTLSSGTGLRVHPRGIESASGISPLPHGEKATYRQTLARHAFHGFSFLAAVNRGSVERQGLNSHLRITEKLDSLCSLAPPPQVFAGSLTRPCLKYIRVPFFDETDLLIKEWMWSEGRRGWRSFPRDHLGSVHPSLLGLNRRRFGGGESRLGNRRGCHIISPTGSNSRKT